MGLLPQMASASSGTMLECLKLIPPNIGYDLWSGRSASDLHHGRPAAVPFRITDSFPRMLRQHAKLGERQTGV